MYELYLNNKFTQALDKTSVSVTDEHLNIFNEQEHVYLTANTIHVGLPKHISKEIIRNTTNRDSRTTKTSKNRCNIIISEQFYLRFNYY